MAITKEPAVLRRGKRFHQRVQTAWKNKDDETFKVERRLNLVHPPELAHSNRYAIPDIRFPISDERDVAIFEIKATDWDRVKHRRKLLCSHQRQMMKYVDQYIFPQNANVCAFMVYPKRPKRPTTLVEVEAFMDEAGISIVWFEDEGDHPTPLTSPESSHGNDAAGWAARLFSHMSSRLSRTLLTPFHRRLPAYIPDKVTFVGWVPTE